MYKYGFGSFYLYVDGSLEYEENELSKCFMDLLTNPQIHKIYFLKPEYTGLYPDTWLDNIMYDAYCSGAFPEDCAEF